MPTWLVTGGSGFLGRHLLDRLEREPVDVVAIGRTPIGRAQVRWTEADLSDCGRLTHLLEDLKPTVIFHLAGKTPPASREALDAANRVATVNLLQSLAEIGRPTRVICVGSAAELGPVPVVRLPVDEAFPPRPADDYGLSKLAATSVALAAGPPIETVVARVFNPIGPGMPSSQALGRFASLLADGSGVLTLDVGNLRPRRDFIDVRDVSESLLTLAQGRGLGLYHIGTGCSHRIEDGLNALISLSGREVRLVHDPSRSRGPTDSRADIGRITNETDWRPRIAFEQSVADLWMAARMDRD